MQSEHYLAILMNLRRMPLMNYNLPTPNFPVLQKEHHFPALLDWFRFAFICKRGFLADKSRSVAEDNSTFPDWTCKVLIAEGTVRYSICLTREFRCHPPAIRYTAHLFIASAAAWKAEQEMNNHFLAHFIQLWVFYIGELLQILR